VRNPDQGKAMPRLAKNAWVLDESGWHQLLTLLSQKMLAVFCPVAFNKFKYNPHSQEPMSDDVQGIKEELLKMCEEHRPRAESRLR
jgi:hypothetical protein